MAANFKLTNLLELLPEDTIVYIEQHMGCRQDPVWFYDHDRKATAKEVMYDIAKGKMTNPTVDVFEATDISGEMYIMVCKKVNRRSGYKTHKWNYETD